MVRERWAGLEPRLTATISDLVPETLSAEVEHPRRGRLSRFEVLMVALRHGAEHMGQAELTRDLIVAGRLSG
jgi:hypothetical protein